MVTCTPEWSIPRSSLADVLEGLAMGMCDEDLRYSSHFDRALLETVLCCFSTIEKPYIATELESQRGVISC